MHFTQRMLARTILILRTWLNAICPEHLGEWKRARFTIHQRFVLSSCECGFINTSQIRRDYHKREIQVLLFFIFKCITVLSVLRKKWESQVRGLECLQDPKSTENSRAGYWTEIKVSSHCSITSFDALSDCNLYSLNLAVGTMESDFKLTRDGECVFFLSILDFGLVWSMSWRWARASTTIRNFMSLTLSTIFPLSLLYAYTLHKHQMSHNSAIRMNTNNWQKKYQVFEHQTNPWVHSFIIISFHQS